MLQMLAGSRAYLIPDDGPREASLSGHLPGDRLRQPKGAETGMNDYRKDLTRNNRICRSILRPSQQYYETGEPMARGVTLDELDRRLLRRLRSHGRESNVDLAREAETSEGTVRARIKRLVDEGVIRSFTVRTTGAALKALIEIATDTNVHTSRLAEEVARCEGVEVVYEVSGDMDVIAIAETDDTEALNELIEKIRNLPNVRSTRSRLILKEA